jgi:hypothetical protein
MLYSILSRLSKPLLVACMFLFSHLSVSAGVTDLRLSTAQIFDVQWNISGGKLNTSGFNYIYSSINYDTQTTSAARWTAAQTTDAGSNGRYISFFHSTTHPGTYGMAVYNSDGSMYKLINNTGSFRTLADGAIFYNGNGMWGTLITTKQGFNYGASASFTITQEYPTNAQLEAYVPDSTTPLAAGETASSSPPPPPPPPTPVYSSGITTQQQTRKTNNLNLNPLGHNTQVNILGDDNIVNIQQIGGRHFVAVDVQGNVNDIEILQTSTVGARHYMEARVVGSNNDLILHQRDSSKTQFVEVMGTHNSVTAYQRGTGNHYLDVRVTGDNHTAGIVQDGSGSHKATVHLDGSQPWNFNLNQNSSTGQTYSLPHGMSDGSTVSGTCSAIGGCNLTVNQQ